MEPEERAREQAMILTSGMNVKSFISMWDHGGVDESAFRLVLHDFGTKLHAFREDPSLTIQGIQISNDLVEKASLLLHALSKADSSAPIDAAIIRMAIDCLAFLPHGADG